MRCDICGTAYSEYFYKNEEQTLCEECILNSDMICTSTNYYLDGEYIGDSESLEFLERLSFKLLPRRKQEISLNNSIYKNTSDVISHGTLILNDRFKLYQVVGAYPKNDSYGQYISWNVELQLFNLAKADGLPNDFKELIEKNQYGLGKINI